MNKSPIKVVFYGTSMISAPTLRAILGDPRYEIVAVVTKPDSRQGRGHKLLPPLIAQIAKENNLKLFQPNGKLSDINTALTKLHPDIGVLVSYGKIIPKSMIDLFPHGIINFHPSMLPLYRGASPIETAIINGDHTTGLTLMSLSPEMDAGDIYYQEKAIIGANETAVGLHVRFGLRGAELIKEKLVDIVSGKLKPVPQDDNLATYCHMLSKNDAKLDPTTMTATDCYNRLRALKKCRLTMDNQEIIVVSAKPIPNFQGDQWVDIVPCAKQSGLQIISIISPKSGHQMTVSQYLNGLKN